MKTVGVSVQEAIDLAGRGLYEAAFVCACSAVYETVGKVSAKENLTESDFGDFLAENFQVLRLMGMPEMTAEIESPASLQKLQPKIKTFYEVRNFLHNLVYQTAAAGKIPFGFCFETKFPSEINIGKVLLPVNLIWGLLASVIFNPANANESVPDKYWFRVGDFKMFISEFWGRQDLAERFIKFAQSEKDD